MESSVVQDTSVATTSLGSYFSEWRPMTDSRVQAVFELKPQYPHQRLAVGICLYNEEGYTLERTLASLKVIHTADTATDGTTLLVPDTIIICDGIETLHPSMTTTLKGIFGSHIPTDPNPWETGFETYVYNTRSVANSSQLSLVLKRHNRKKINSHEWFFRAFALPSRAMYALTTDTGTVFGSTSVNKFIRYMDKHPNCSALAGRQRGMTAAMQADPANNKTETWMASFLRAWQRYDFEMEASNSLAFASMALGWIPVLHGPCSLFRTNEIEGACLDTYFAIAYKQEVSLVEANLVIGEDKIPSLLAITKTKGSKHTQWMGIGRKNAPFYHEAETTLRAYVTQRRRWYNSTVCGHLFILLNLSEYGFWGSDLPSFKKILLTIFLVLETINTLILRLASPGIFGAMFNVIFTHLADRMDALVVAESAGTNGNVFAYAAQAMVALYIILYVSFVVVHHKRMSKVADAKAVIHPALFVTSLVYNALMMVATAVGLATNWATMVLVPFVIAVLLPVAVAAVCDARGALPVMLNPLNFVTYWVSAPTFIGFMSAYAISRLADVSWGNRPQGDEELSDTLKLLSAEELSVAAGKEQKHCSEHAWLQTQMKHTMVLNVVIVTLNVLLIFGAPHILTDMQVALAILGCFALSLFQQIIALMLASVQSVTRNQSRF